MPGNRQGSMPYSDGSDGDERSEGIASVEERENVKERQLPVNE